MTRTETNRDSMNILILNYEYPPLGGGAGVATQYLINALAQYDDIHVDLVTSSMDRTRVEWPHPNTRIHYLDIGKQGSIHYQSELNLLTYAVRSYFYARKLQRERSFDVIHAFFGIPSGRVAQALGVPYIVSLRGSDVPFYNNRFALLDKLIFKRMSRAIWRHAAMVVANSAGLRNLAQKSAPRQSIDVIYNGVDTDIFTLPTHPKKNKKLTLISTGRLIERKGYHYLIEALDSMSDVRLLLIGDGNRQAALESLAHRHRVDTRFLGAQPREAVIENLQKADLFVSPSLNEGMSNALLEALAAGLPVVVTDVGGSNELVDGNGFIVEKADAAALRSAIMNYITTPRLIDIHGKASRKMALTMSVSTMAARYVDLYRQVAAAPRRS